MSKTSPSRLHDFSKQLRKDMTPQEKHLWYDFLKQLPITVNRQKVIGPYIVDFLCFSARIVIEIDGSQHYSEQAKEYDKKRDEYLNSLGYTVLRYTDFDVNQNFRGVCKDILNHISFAFPSGEVGPPKAVDEASLPLRGRGTASAVDEAFDVNTPH